MSERRPKSTRKVLADHKRVGKKFIPPLLQLSGEFRDAPWLDRPLPELIWIGLLHDRLGFERGSDCASALARTAQTVAGGKLIYASVTALETLDPLRWRRAVRLLDELELTGTLRDALEDLVVLYPECALRSLWVNSPDSTGNGHLERFKAFLEPLFYRHDRPATLIAGTAMRLAIESGRLHVAPHISLPNWKALRGYPDSEESKRVGASCRSAMGMLFNGPNDDNAPVWPTYFWNRGLELEPCSHPDLGDEDDS